MAKIELIDALVVISDIRCQLIGIDDADLTKAEKNIKKIIQEFLNMI